MTDKIARAASATVEVQARVRQALDALDGFNGRVVNGFGFYADVSRQRLHLIEARDSIVTALKVMSDTAWPTNDDYEAT